MDQTNKAPTVHLWTDWYVYEQDGRYFVVDTLDGKPVRSLPASHRDITQATLRGKFRSHNGSYHSDQEPS